MDEKKQPLRYLLSSLSSWVLDNGVLWLAVFLLEPGLGAAATPVGKTVARVISSFFNFNLNRSLVFGSKGAYGSALLRYYCLAVPQLIVSTLLLSWLTGLLEVHGATLITLVNIVVDGVLFILSFFIQKFWVFRKKEKSETHKP